MKGVLVSALLWTMARLFAPPAPAPIDIELPLRLIPRVKEHIGGVVKAAYLLGAFNGASIAAPVCFLLGIGATFALIALFRFLSALAALVRSGVKVLDALALLLSRRARSIEFESPPLDADPYR